MGITELIQLLDELESPHEIKLDTKFQDAIIASLADIEGIDDYLRMTLSLDMKRYFVAQDEIKPVIKGGFSRTLDLHNKIIAHRKKRGVATS